MLIVETIAKIRRLFREHRSIREISRELRLSRKVVRKALRSDKTAFAYKRQHQPRPQLDGHIARIDALLSEELVKPKRERLSLMRLFEGLRTEGHGGGYDAGRRYAQRWFAENVATATGVFVPLAFGTQMQLARGPALAAPECSAHTLDRRLFPGAPDRRAPAAYWWARTTVASTKSRSQSSSPRAFARAYNCCSTRSVTPAMRQRQKRLDTTPTAP